MFAISQFYKTSTLAPRTTEELILASRVATSVITGRIIKPFSILLYGWVQGSGITSQT